MAKDLIIASNRHETKMAMLEDEQLVEMYFQRANEYSLVGSIHKGRVTRVLPGMQSAFVDIGLDRDAFLYVSDFFEDSEEYEELDAGEKGGHDRSKPRMGGRDRGADGEEDKGGAAESGVKDRRGRRSRRRRGKGRGLPESKYASGPAVESQRREKPEIPPPVREQEQERDKHREKPVESSPEEILLLPGESLAKYNKADKITVSEMPEEAGASEEEGVVAAAGLAGDDPASINDSAAEAEESLDRDAVEEARVRTAEEDDSSDEEEDSREAAENDDEEDDFPEGDEETGDDYTADDLRDGEDDEQDLDGEDDENEEDSLADDVEDAGVRGMTPGHLDEEAGEEANEDAAKDEERKTGDRPEKEPKRTAKVREKDSRYMHRSGRRGRGRGRGERPESEPQATNGDEGKESPRGERGPLPLISDLLTEGQEILVQIAKEPLGQKGARITSHIALPGRYVVYMPTLEHLGVSRKIGSDEERHRLRRILQNNREGISGGFIMRTAGEGKSEKDIAADMRFLSKLWTDIRQTAERRRAPVLLHHDLQVVERVLRDQVSEDFSTVWVDTEETYEEVLRFLQRFQPALVNRVKMYTRSAPIFDAFNITQELEKALRPKVWLKSGGYIVINQTEALVAIDINTGKYVGKSNRLEDTIVRTNIEAVKEIVRQMRLRDLGGIIVVDFIDMDERKNRQKVMQALEEAMRKDRAPYKILQFNDFGLVAITRKRVKQSLERTLCMPCPYCEGAAYVKSVDTIIGEILIEAHKMAEALTGEDVILRVHPDVAKVLKNSSNEYLQEIEETVGRPVLVTADPVLHHEKFDLA